jgi:hypothetical protein
MACLSVVVCFVCSWCHAEQLVGALPINKPLSVRQMGMGDVSVGGGDVLRSWSNPAMLSRANLYDDGNILEIAGTAGEAYANLFSTVGGGGIGYRINRNLAVGALMSAFVKNLSGVDANGNTTYRNVGQDVYAGGLVVSYNQGYCGFGLNVKGVSETIDMERKTTASVDAGAMVTLLATQRTSDQQFLGGLIVGIALRNITGILQKDSVNSIGEILPMEIRGSVACPLAMINTTLGVEYIKRRQDDKYICTGLEWRPFPIISIRAGVTGIGNDLENVGYTGGLSLIMKKVGKIKLYMDYAAVTHPVGLTHMVCIGGEWGTLGPAVPKSDRTIKENQAVENKVRIRKPPRLTVKAETVMDNKDNSLSADSSGLLMCHVINDGGGPAIGVSISISHKPGGGWMSYKDIWNIGDIPEGKEEKVEVPLKVARNSPEGEVIIHIEAKESNGFDADPQDFYTKAHEFMEPELRIQSVRVFDGESAYALGNGNGELEPGESAEIILKIENTGRGPTRGTKLSASSKAEPMVLVTGLNGRDDRSVKISDIMPGRNVEVKVAVVVTKRFAGGVDLPVDLTIEDERPGLTRSVSIPVKVSKASARTTMMRMGGGSSTMAVSSGSLGELNVAVADLEAQEVSSSEAVIASDWLRNALVSLGTLRVVDRSSMQKIMAEQTIQQTGCTRQDCAVKIGKLLNVQRMVVGNFGKFAGKYVMTIQVVNVETGQVVYASQASGKDQPELDVDLRLLAERIGKQLR